MDNSSFLNSFQKKKRRIINNLQKMVELGFVPATANGKEYTAEKVDEIIRSLEDEHFTISVCGQINAGKSSLLNYLLFKDQSVLPADDTPWTAKLSTIQYAEKEEAIITYYNEIEWEELINQKLFDEQTKEEFNYYQKFLKIDVDNAALNGVNKESLIFSKNKIEKGISLSVLENFVTKTGYYTPFVKSVDIYVNNELCKDVVFVDTPGINDSNELRSKVTTDWISKSSAVIYLFYTGQPLSKADYNFIDKHLSTISPDKIMFVLTKADTSGDYQSAVRYVENSLKNDIELRNRRLFSNGTKVYPISTYAALFNYKSKNGIQFSEEEEFHHERLLDGNSDFYEKEGYIPEFISGIQSYLMSSKGQSLLKKGEQIINDLGQTKINSIKLQINSLKDFENDLSKSSDELETKKNNISNILNEVTNFQNKFKESLNELINDLDKGFIKTISESTIAIRNKTLASLSEIGDSYEKRELVQWHFKDHFRAELFNLDTNLLDLKVAEKTNNLLEDFEKEVKRILTSLKGVKIQFFTSGSLGIKDLFNNFSLESISDEALKSKGAVVYLKTINWNSGKFDSLLKSEIHKLENLLQTQLLDTIAAHFNNKIIEFFDNYLIVIRNKLGDVTKSYEEISQMNSNYEENKKIIIKKIIHLHNEEAKFIKLITEIGNYE